MKLLARVFVTTVLIAQAISGTLCLPVPVREWNKPQYAVFVGRVVSSDNQKPDGTYAGEVSIDVIEPLKGVPKRAKQVTIDVLLNPHNKTPFVNGAILLVVALIRDGKLLERACPLSRRLDEAKNELEAFRRMQAEAAK